MRIVMMKKLMLTFMSIIALATVTAYAALVGELGVLDTSGINPATGAIWKAGDQYRLAFVTSGTTDATSTNIATYNAFVQDAANAAGLGSAAWYVIASTETVAARDNTSTNPGTDGVGVPIFLTDGSTLFAINNNDLWNGASVPLNMDEYGDVATNTSRIFAGTFTDGTRETVRYLGTTIADPTSIVVQTGNATKTGSYWIRHFNSPVTDSNPIYALSEPLTVQENYPTVDAGHSWITWSNQPVILDPIVVNNDTQVPQRELTCVWSANPADGVSITEDGSALDDITTPGAVVTITKSPDSGNPAVVTLMLSITLKDVVTISDTMTIDVYDNSCKAAAAVGIEAAFDPADFNTDCIIDITDLAAMVAAWLEDYSLSES